MNKKKAVSNMLAMILLIAVSVASAVILYFFVSGIFSSSSFVRGTITQPLQLTVVQVSKVTSSPCSTSSPCYTLSLQVINPGDTSVTLNYAVITDSSGNNVAASSMSISVSSHENTVITASTLSGLTPVERYRVTLLGTDSAGNSYTSNPAVFTTY